MPAKRPPLPDPLSGRAFRLDEAAAVGVTRSQPRSREVRRPWRGVYEDVQLLDTLVGRCRALSTRLPPESAFSHQTALALLGLRTPFTVGYPGIHVSVPVGVTVPKVSGLTGHVCLGLQERTVLAAGLRVSAPASAWGQLAAAGAALEDLVVVADGILARYGPDARNTMEQQVEHSIGRRGVTGLRKALEWARPGTDSAPESVLRMRFVLDGLPVPAVNFTVLGPDGAWLHRPDLAFVAYRLAYDYDGRVHYSGDERQHARDMARVISLAEAGWTLRIVTARDLAHGSRQLLNTARTLLAERGAGL